jgi:hypothetical protein
LSASSFLRLSLSSIDPLIPYRASGKVVHSGLRKTKLCSGRSTSHTGGTTYRYIDNCEVCDGRRAIPGSYRINAAGDPVYGILSLSLSRKEEKANSVMCQAAFFRLGEPSRDLLRCVNPLPFGTTTACLRMHDVGYREQNWTHPVAIRKSRAGRWSFGISG